MAAAVRHNLLLLLFITTLYISLCYSADLTKQVYIPSTSIFSISLDVPTSNTKDFCVEGRIGYAATSGPYQSLFCTKSSINGYRPDLCSVPYVGGIDNTTWTFKIASPPDGVKLNVTAVEVYHTITVKGAGPFYEVDDTPLIPSEPHFLVPAGNTVKHRVSLATDEPEYWGYASPVGAMKLSFLLRTTENTSSNDDVKFTVQYPCSGKGYNSSSTGELIHVGIPTEELKKNGWGDWFLVIENKKNEDVEYTLNYMIEGSIVKCQSVNNTMCNNHGACVLSDDLQTASCKCYNCFYGDQCQSLETCSENHGICDFDTGLCKCNDGYSGIKCEMGEGLPAAPKAEILTSGGAALLAIGMFLLGSIAGVVTLLIVNKKIRRAVYEEVSIRDTDTFSKAVS